MPSNEELMISAIYNRVYAIQASGRKTTYADPVNGDESNDGMSPTTPKLYAQSATDLAGIYGCAVLLPGIFDENVVVTQPNLWLIGATYDGPNKTAIAPATGVPLTFNEGLCMAENLYLSSGNNHCLKATGPSHDFHLLAIEPPATKYGVWLNDADQAKLKSLYLDGGGLADTIGVLFGSGTVSASIEDSVITNFGSGLGAGVLNGYGIAYHGSSQRNRATHNFISNCAYGQYHYTSGGSSVWHEADQNEYYLNRLYDFYSPDAMGVSGIRVDGNFYGYTGWYDDHGIHTGIADFTVPCGDDANDPLYDFAPLVSPDAFRFIHEARNR